MSVAKEIFDNVDMYQGLEVWRKITQRINVWGERRRDELAEIVNSSKFIGKVEDMAKVLEAWDTSHRHYVAVGGRALMDEDRLRILKKIVPQVFLNDLITKDFHDWPVAKEWVLEMSRRLAMHGRPSKLLHLAEAEGAGDAAQQLGEALALLGEGATTEEILAVVASKRPWLKRKPPGAAGSARPPPGGAGSAATARPSPTTKDGRKLCSNCGETGHDKTACKQPKTDFSKRVCWACKKPGHSSSQCPTKADVRILQEEGDEEPAAFMLEESVEEPYWAAFRDHAQQRRGAPAELDNSFEALAEDSEEEALDDADDDDEDDACDECGHDDAYDECGHEKSIAEHPQSPEILELQSPCCRWKCEDRDKLCRVKMMAEFKAEIAKSWEKAALAEFQEGDEESSDGFAAESEREEEEQGVIDEAEDPPPVMNSPVSIETQKKSSIFATPEMTTSLSPFFFSPSAQTDESIKLSGAITKKWRHGRHHRAAFQFGDDRRSESSPEKPEVVEWIEDDAAVAEKMLRTIQAQKEELRRNGEAIHRLAQEVNETKLMTTGGVRGVIGTRADEVLTETPSGTRHFSASGSDGDEVIDCSISEEFEEFEVVNDEVCCYPCVEEGWLMSKCCKDDIHPSEQHNDDATWKRKIDADDALAGRLIWPRARGHFNRRGWDTWGYSQAVKFLQRFQL